MAVPFLAGLQHRESFVSRDDFRMSSCSDILSERHMVTPKVLKSRNTSAGVPDF